jgi:hypothetical protein
LQVGAKPYRCAACRCNFASFRPRRQKFEWRHQTHTEENPALGPDQLNPDLTAQKVVVNAESNPLPPPEAQA